MLYTSAEIARGPDWIRSQSWNWSVASRCVYRIWQQLLKSSLETNTGKHPVFHLRWIILKFQNILFRMEFHRDNNVQILTICRIYKLYQCAILSLDNFRVFFFFWPPQNQNTSQNKRFISKDQLFCIVSQ